MSKKPKPVMIGRIIIKTPEEQAAESARTTKALWARNKAINKKQLAAKQGRRPTEYAPGSQFVRPGADDALEIPSRYGDSLHYRDGRCTDMAGNPLPTHSTPNL